MRGCTALIIGSMLFSGCANAKSALPFPSFEQTEHLKTEIPSGWRQILDSKSSNLHIAEYAPHRSPQSWTRKISVEALSGANLPDPLEFADNWSADQAALCHGFKDHHIFSGFENGYPTVVRMLVCGSNRTTSKPITTMLKVIRGNKSLYTITRIWRLNEFPPGAEIAAWSNILARTIACDPRLPAHPCPGEPEQAAQSPASTR